MYMLMLVYGCDVECLVTVSVVCGHFTDISATLYLSTALLVGGSRDRTPVVSLGIFSEATDGNMCPGVDSASKNEYRDTSWG